MDFEDMDLDEFFGLEPEEGEEGANEQDVAEPAQAEDTEGENEQESAEPAGGTDEKSEMSPEERHANAARRRAAELDGVRKAERDRAKAEMDALVKDLGLKNPYDGNKPIETREQYDAYKRAQTDKALERGLSSGRLTAGQLYDAIDARIAAKAPAPAAAADAPTQEELAEVERQYAALKTFDANAPELDELVQNEAFIRAAEKTRDMLEAYKLAFFDELQARQAQAGKRDAANRAQEKAHLQRTASRGTGAVEVTQEMRSMYRVFDPDITDDEIRKYESKDLKIRR